MTQISATDVRRAAMGLLARREHGFQELTLKLKLKFSRKKYTFETDYSASNLEHLLHQELSKLRDDGLQGDDRMAEVYIRARSNRGHGPIKIKVELRGKGVSDAVVSQAFAECKVNWFDLVARIAHRKYGDLPLDAKDRAKRSRFLQQRGFSFDHIRAIEPEAS